MPFFGGSRSTILIVEYVLHDDRRCSFFNKRIYILFIATTITDTFFFFGMIMILMHGSMASPVLRLEITTPRLYLVHTILLCSRAAELQGAKL
jgi:hypothetical protein